MGGRIDRLVDSPARLSIYRFAEGPSDCFRDRFFGRFVDCCIYSFVGRCVDGALVDSSLAWFIDLLNGCALDWLWLTARSISSPMEWISDWSIGRLILIRFLMRCLVGWFVDGSFASSRRWFSGLRIDSLIRWVAEWSSARFTDSYSLTDPRIHWLRGCAIYSSMSFWAGWSADWMICGWIDGANGRLLTHWAIRRLIDWAVRRWIRWLIRWLIRGLIP